MATAASTLAACTTVGRKLVQDSVPDSLSTVLAGGDPATRLARRILDRAGYGPRPGDVGRVRDTGLEAYLEEQLYPQSIDDTPTNLLIRNLYYYHMDIDQLISKDRDDVAHDLAHATLIRALTSRRQLYEAMVEFWSDHFNVYLPKKKDFVNFKVIEDREVIRPHAMGSFRDLLFASAQSPAMLIYLDNISNVASAPNENYARELMELHTLGVNGGYDQDDVEELARALTGWGVARRGRRSGQFSFDDDQHDTGTKFILEHSLAAGRGEEDVTDVLEILAAHPSTAHFIATKLVRRFVADDPPPTLVENVTRDFLSTDGDIKSMLRTIFRSDEFASAGPKLKRPYSFAISALRALHADVGPRAIQPLTNALDELGQLPFHWPMPDGYPDEASAWMGNLLARWNYALALLDGQFSGINLPLERLAEAGQVNDTLATLDFFATLTLGGSLDPSVMAALSEYIGTKDPGNAIVPRRMNDVIALMIASPDFQWM